MSFIQALFMASAFSLAVALFQWWALRKIHRRRMASAQQRHLKAQQAAAELLKQCRRQIAQLHKDHAEALNMEQRSIRAVSQGTTEMLTRMLNESDGSAQAHSSWPTDGFADTVMDEHHAAAQHGRSRRQAAVDPFADTVFEDDRFSVASAGLRFARH